MSTTASPQPRRMWTDPHFHCFTDCHGLSRINPSDGTFTSMSVPVAVIPLSDPEALVQRVKEAIWCHEAPFAQYSQGEAMFEAAARRALIALGVLPATKRRRKGARK